MSPKFSNPINKYKEGFLKNKAAQEASSGSGNAQYDMKDMELFMQASNEKAKKGSDKFEAVHGYVKQLSDMSKGSVTLQSALIFQGAQEALMKACDEYLKSRKGAITGKGKERYAMVEEVYRLCKMQQASGLGSTEKLIDISTDNKKIKASSKYNTEAGIITWGDIMNAGRVIKAQTPPELQGAGGNSNGKTEVEVDGKKGFFTPDIDDKQAGSQFKTTETPRERFFNLLDVSRPDIKKAILKNQKELWEILENSPLLNKNQGTRSEHKKIRENVLEFLNKTNSPLSASDRQVLVNTLQTGIFKFSIVDWNIKQREKEEKLKGYIDFSSTKNNKKVASSQFASLVGCKDLVAKVDKMILDGSKPGIFTEYAKGEDLDKLGKKGGENLPKVNNFTHPQFLKQLSSLEVLDAVTQQADHHPGNLTYQVGTQNQKDGTCPVVGVQGKNNGMAFGEKSEGDSLNHAPAINQIKVVDKTLKDALASVDKDITHFVLVGLVNSEEVDKLTQNIEMMNQHLAGKDVMVVKSDEWEQKAPEIAEKMKGSSKYYVDVTNNFFEKMHTYKESVRTPIQESQLAAAEKNAAAGGGIQKKAPIMGTHRTAGSKVKVAIDNDLDDAQKKPQTKAQTKPQPAKQSTAMGKK